MFVYWWHRHVRYRQEFEKDNNVDAFAVYTLAANIESIKKKGDRLREEVRHIRSRRLSWSEARRKLEEEADLLQDAEFHSVASKFRRLVIVLALIALAESGLNYFTALIAIPASGFLAGAIGTALRLSAAVIITVIGIIGAENFLDEVLPNKRARAASSDKPSEGPSWVRAGLWLLVLLGTEYMIFHFGLVRVKDIEGGRVDPDIAKSIIVLSMIVPVVGGGIAWEISTIRDPYKNRLKHDRLSKRIGNADTRIETLNERENGFFQRKTNDYWYTFNRLKAFKEYFNTKRGEQTPPLGTEASFAQNHEGFYERTLYLYNQHKEKQDAVGRLKIGSGGYTSVGHRIGQDA